jgi:hypothetical protein
MGRPELGTKCTCTGCSERFYDLNRAPATCPKCGVQQAPRKARVPWPAGSAAGPRRPHRPPEPVLADDDAAPMTSDEDEDEQDEAVDDSEDGDAATVIDPDHDATHD